MNFAAFQDCRGALLRERNDVRDCAETNLYRALAHLAPPPTPAPETTVHRCHLAAEWVNCFRMDVAVTGRALVSCGVRDSLARLFSHYAGLHARLWLPEDNYPVYAELARASGLSFDTFPTLPEPMWPEAGPTGDCEILLVTSPLKPRGRWLNDADVATLSNWVAQNPRRRILLDGVYVFDTQFDPATQRLLITGQTILLHSVTKGWLHPRLFGITLVPAQDADSLTPLFRSNAPPQESLARAQQMFGLWASVPATIAASLAEARERMHDALPPDFPRSWSCDGPGYLSPIGASWRKLLDTHRVLGIPATVFGSPREDITILSSLSSLP